MIAKGGAMKAFKVLIVALVFLAGCSSGGGLSAIVIDQPSDGETTFAELRDFYVIGSYSEGITRPGDIKIELFRGEVAVGTPIRTIQSHVDTTSCLTPESALDLDYPNGDNFGVTMVPDIVKEPGSIYDPNNKVVVTQEYFAGLILGGATKDFDTTYEDSDGNPLEDLTEGTYTIKVTGLSCQTAYMTATKTVQFGLTHASLGRFSPDSSLQKLEAFTQENGYRIYRNNFPGYFAWQGNLYEIKSRWMPNNSIEVVNDLEGTMIDNVQSALNDMLVYNVRPTSATNTVETAALVKNELTESENTAWHYYDVGEPTLYYVDEDGEPTSLDCSFADFAANDRHVLIRAEVQVKDETSVDNVYNVEDPTEKRVDLNPSDGVAMTTADELNLFGVVRAIPSTVTAGTHSHEYTIDNTINVIRYTIRDSEGGELLTVDKEINLERIYDPTNPDNRSLSSYEYKHKFSEDIAAGEYEITAVGVDTNEEEVDGTREEFTLTVE